VKEADLDRATAIAVKNAYANPRPIQPGSIRELLQAAWDGCRPGG
jgi:maleylacetate reductase